MSTHHEHEHDHHHAAHPAPAQAASRSRTLSASLIALSALQRLLIVTPLLVLLWVAVYWALGDAA